MGGGCKAFEEGEKGEVQTHGRNWLLVGGGPSSVETGGRWLRVRASL